MSPGSRADTDTGWASGSDREAVVITDTESLEIVGANRAAGLILGETRETLRGRRLTDLNPPGESARYRARYEELRAAEPVTVSSFEDGDPLEVVGPNGEPIPVTVRARRIARPEGAEIQWVFRERSTEDDTGQNPYQTAVESTVNPIAAVDTSLRYLFANAAYCEPLEYGVEEIVGESLEDVIGPRTFAQIEAHLEEALTGRPVHFETERVFPSGETRHYEATYSPLLEEDGEVSGLIGSFNEVTTRKEREEELERLFDGMADAAFLHQPHGPFEVVNQTAVERYGYSETELCSMSPMDLDVEGEAEKVPERSEQVAEEGRLVFETAHETKSGAVIPVEISSSRIQYKGRTAVLSIARDISRRKASERKFEVLFNNAADAMVHTRFEDGEPIVQAVNPAFEDTFGFEESHIGGESLSVVFESGADAFEMERINRRIADGEHTRLEIQRQTPEGRRDFMLRSIPIDAQAGEYYRIYTDITERKDRERTLTRQRDELGTLNRLNELVLDLIQELVASESRERIEATVCTELADSELYGAAWIGTLRPDTETVVRRAGAGGLEQWSGGGPPEGNDTSDAFGQGYSVGRDGRFGHDDDLHDGDEVGDRHDGDDVREDRAGDDVGEVQDGDDVGVMYDTDEVGEGDDFDTGDEGPEGSWSGGVELARSALRTGELQVVQNTGADPRMPPGSGRGPEGTVRALAAIPLSPEGSVDAVLVVHSPREYAFGGRELAGLETLGKIVEFAIIAIKNRKLLSTDTVCEVEFDVGETAHPLVELSRDLACTLSLDGSVSAGSSDSVAVYLDVAGTEVAMFVERATGLPGVEGVTHISSEGVDSHRFEVTLGTDLLGTLRARHRTRLQTIELDDGAGTIVFDVPLSEDVRDVVELVQGAYPEARFVAKREREYDTEAHSMATALRSALTDRQYETLKNAKLAGYFEWPRESTTEDIAETLDLTSSTVQYHLRTALATLVDEVFE